MMNKQLELQLLSPNKSVFFTSPLEDKKTCLSRTGVIHDDENSFIHAVLGAYSKEYFNLNSKDKSSFLSNFKKSIYEKKNWKNDKKQYLFFAEGINDCYISLKKNIKRISESQTVDKDKLNSIKNKIALKIIKHMVLKNINLYDLIVDVMDVKFIFDDKEIEDYSISSYKKLINKHIDEKLESVEILKRIDEKRSEFIKKGIVNFFNAILDKVEDQAYKMYLYKIKRVKCDSETLVSLSRILKRNIYFVDSETRLPYIFDETQKNNHDKSVIILKIKNDFEIIGKLYSGNKIKNDFDREDLIIKKIKMFIYEPEKIKYNYPELSKYVGDEDEEDEKSDYSSDSRNEDEEEEDKDQPEPFKEEEKEDENEDEETKEDEVEIEDEKVEETKEVVKVEVEDEEVEETPKRPIPTEPKTDIKDIKELEEIEDESEEDSDESEDDSDDYASDDEEDSDNEETKGKFSLV